MAKRAGKGQSKMTKLHRQAAVVLAAKRQPEAFALPTVTPEAARHGDYHEAWTEVDGLRRRVLLNRGGSTIQRWMNTQPDDVLGDSERAAIRYCQRLWSRLDYRGPKVVHVDNGGAGEAEHEALAELSALKIKLPLRHWSTFENICRFEQTADNRHTKVTVGFVAGMIALWRGL